MKISMIGTGYVGLISGTCLAEIGNHVTCMDVDEEKIHMLAHGLVPIHEPDLESMVRVNVRGRRLFFTADANEATQNAEVIFITVGTPPGEDGSSDLRHVYGAARKIGQTMCEFKAIVIKSTVPVGTAQKVKEVIARELAARQIHGQFEVVSNPEFLREGVAIENFMRPDRIVLGCDSDRAEKIMLDLYDPLVKQGCPVHVMDTKSAEMTKYAANCMLATRISFMNEVAFLCDKTGADITKVHIGIGSDSRIGMSFLYSGLGFGGSCFPKDLRALMNNFSESGIKSDFFKAVEDVNIRQRRLFIDKILSVMGDNLAGKMIAIWGLAFKPDTSDMREAPSIDIIRGLISHGATVRVFDPHAAEEARRQFSDIAENFEFGEDMYQCLDKCDCLVLVTEWDQFKQPDFSLIGAKLRHKLVFDGRNIYEPDEMAAMGFEYHSVGRRKSIPVQDRF